MATYNGVNYDKQVDGDKIKGEVNVKLRIVKDTYVSATTLNDDEVLLPKIPEGALILDAYLMTSADCGAAGTINLGLKAFTDKDGNTVSEDEDSLVAALNGVGAAALTRATAASVAIGKIVGVGGVQPFIKMASDITNDDVIITAVVMYAIE